MTELFQNLSLLAATIALGMMAGLFTAFSYAIMPGLARTGDRTFVHAMQRINVAILNGWFGFGFAGSLIFTAIAAVLHLGAGDRDALPWIIAALVLYVATLAITFRVNVPLNNELDRAGEPGAVTDPGAVRRRFEATWVRWNHVRSVTSTLALGCLAWALLQH
ncbi:DUF1772 domain-containing protein [Actinomadura fulvescens]|uniref:DUF1772 domain-containing protein n=2 Tax=Actinomadura fulvescens TaxID=46160 RepID=A0ABP6BZ59_9ACTN